MESNCKNWRRCNISKKRLVRLLIINLSIVIVLSFVFMVVIDYRLKHSLDNYISIESERVASHVINQSIKDLNYSPKYYLSSEDERLSYDFNSINKYKDTLTKRIQYYFSLIENGNYSKYPLYTVNYNRNKYENVRKGYLCEMSINSLFDSVIFANVGPTIPIKLSFVGEININIEIKTKEYGINNVIVEIYAIVDVTNKISMPIGKKKTSIRVKEPITVDIVKGTIPNYYIH